RELISETAPPPALLEPLARRFRASGYRIADLVGAMLRSRLFFSAHAFQKRIKGPAEFVLGAVQAAWPGSVSTPGLPFARASVGQPLSAPPTARGWPGGRSWLNTSPLLARNNFAEQVVLGKGAFAPRHSPDDVPESLPPPEDVPEKTKKGKPPG